MLELSSIAMSLLLSVHATETACNMKFEFFRNAFTLNWVYWGIAFRTKKKEQISLIITDRVNAKLLIIIYCHLWWGKVLFFVCAVCSLIAGHEMCEIFIRLYVNLVSETCTELQNFSKTVHCKMKPFLFKQLQDKYLRSQKIDRENLWS